MKTTVPALAYARGISLRAAGGQRATPSSARATAWGRGDGGQDAAELGRKVFLFVGHLEAGENLAGLYSLVASCELHGVNPIAYLSDVLLRIDRHPASRIDELLPGAWAAAQ